MEPASRRDYGRTVDRDVCGSQGRLLVSSSARPLPGSARFAARVGTQSQAVADLDRRRLVQRLAGECSGEVTPSRVSLAGGDVHPLARDRDGTSLFSAMRPAACFLFSRAPASADSTRRQVRSLPSDRPVVVGLVFSESSAQPGSRSGSLLGSCGKRIS